jgi:hypothetical protein
MYPSQSPLPVDPLTVNGQGMWHSPSANNLPFMPTVSSSPNAQQWVPTIAGHLIGAVQANAMKNAVRIFTFNMLSANRYNNDLFIRTLTDAVWYFDLAMSYTQNGRPADPNQVANAVATEYAKIAAALLVQQYPAMQQYLNAELQNDLNKALDTHRNVQHQVEQRRVMANHHVVAPVQGSWPNQQNQPAQPYQGQTAGPVHMHGNGTSAHAWPLGGIERGADGLTPFERQTGAKPKSEQMDIHQLAHSQTFDNLGSYAQTSSGDAYGGGIVTGGLKPRPLVKDTITMTEISLDEPVPQIKVVEIPPAQLPENPIHLQPDPGPVLDTTYVYKADDGSTRGDFGEVIEFAALSQLTLTSKVRPVYDPSRYVACYRKLTDGSVSIVLADRNEDMSWNYNEHELNPGQVAGQVPPKSPDAPAVGVTAEGMENLKRLNEELEEQRVQEAQRRAEAQANPPPEEGSPDLDLGQYGVTSDRTVFFCHDHKDAQHIAGLNILSRGGSDKSINEYFYRTAKAFSMENATKVLQAHLELTGSDLNYEKAYVNLGQLMDGDHDKELWTEINRRLTRLLLNTMHADLSMPEGWSIDSFVEDYADLEQLLSQHFSPDFMELFESTAKKIVPQAALALSDAQQTSYLTGLVELGGDISDEVASNLMVLSEYWCGVDMPIKEKDLEPFLTTGVMAEEAVVFHKLLKNIFENAQTVSAGESPRILLSMRDNAIYEVHKSLMVDDVYVLRCMRHATELLAEL